MAQSLPNYSYKLNQVKTGTKEELEEYVLSFTPKVKHILSKFQIEEKYYGDLLQAGLLGVIEGVRRYNVNDKVPFSTFLNNCIIHRIQDTLKSVGLFSGFSPIEPTRGLYDKMILDGNELDYSDSDKAYFSAESENYSENDDVEFLDNEVVLPITRYPVYEREVEDQALELADFETIITYLSWLDKRTQFIIIHYLGLFGNTPKTQEQIGEILGLSGYGVSLIYHKGIRKIKLLCHKPDWYMSREKQARVGLK